MDDDGTLDTGGAPSTAAATVRAQLERAAEAAYRYRAALTLAALLMAALALRLYRLGDVPSNLTADETDFFRDAYAVLEGHGKGTFSTDQTATIAPLGIELMAWCLRIFGDSIAGLRMYAVLFSLATLVPFFALVRHRCSLLVAAAVTLRLATNIWFMNFSRTAWANMNAAFLAIGVTCTLQLALERRRWWLFAVAGVLIGLAPWAYLSARIIPLIVLTYTPLALFIYRDRWRETLRGLALAGGIALVIAAPLLIELRQGFWDEYSNRATRVSIFEGRDDDQAWELVPGNIRRTVRGFIFLSNDDNIFRRSTEGSRYAPRDADMFDPLTRVLFLVGLVAGVWTWRRSALWFLMLFAPLTAQVFSNGTPDAARGLIVLPVIFLFVALGAQTIVTAIAGGVRDRRVLTAAGVALLAGSVALGAWNVRQYFDWMESAYALDNRGPAVKEEEFEEWSLYQRRAAEDGRPGVNTGTWRERQDRAGCLTGFVVGEICDYLSVDASPDRLGATLVRIEDAPGLQRIALMEISGDEYRETHKRSDRLAGEFARLDVQRAWVVVFVGREVTLTASVARLASEQEADAAMLVRSSLTGQDFLGGPKSEQMDAPPLGDGAIFQRVYFRDREWYVYFWRDGAYVAQVQMMYTGLGLAQVEQQFPPFPLVENAVKAQAARLSEASQ